jgi:hypothetical protein
LAQELDQNLADEGGVNQKFVCECVHRLFTQTGPVY